MAEKIIYDEQGNVVEATSDGLLMFAFDSKEFNKEIKSSFPTDIIDINYTLKQKLYELSDVTEDDDEAIPSDIILSKTIPLEDVFMNITDIGARNIDTQRCRIKMMDDWKSKVDNFKKEIMKHEDYSEYMRQQLGYVMIEVRNDSWIYMVFGLSALDQIDILDGGVGYIKNTNNNTIVEKEILSFLSKNAPLINPVDGMSNIFFSVLKTWYATQVCLLHPVIKECFKSETYALVQRKGTTSKSRNGKKKPPKIKYVKRRVIDDEEFDRLFDDATKRNNYTRTALIWYVTGHWREYRKTGKRIFIEGYWKGALRDIKKSDIRERELVLPDDKNGD